MKSIFISDPLAFQRRLPRPAPTTCEWIVDNKEYRNWLSRESHQDILWIKGRAGVGKTVLSSFLLDIFQPRFANVCFFFFDTVNTQQKTALLALRSILHGLFEAHHCLLQYAMQFFTTRNVAILDDLVTMWDIFSLCLKDPSIGDVVCVLDALDECEQPGRDELLGYIKAFDSQMKQFGEGKKVVKFLFTIKDALWQRGNQLVLESSDVTEKIVENVEYAINHEVDTMPALRHWYGAMENEVKSF